MHERFQSAAFIASVILSESYVVISTGHKWLHFDSSESIHWDKSFRSNINITISLNVLPNNVYVHSFSVIAEIINMFFNTQHYCHRNNDLC